MYLDVTHTHTPTHPPTHARTHARTQLPSLPSLLAYSLAQARQLSGVRGTRAVWRVCQVFAAGPTQHCARWNAKKKMSDRKQDIM